MLFQIRRAFCSHVKKNITFPHSDFLIHLENKISKSQLELERRLERAQVASDERLERAHVAANERLEKAQAAMELRMVASNERLEWAQAAMEQRMQKIMESNNYKLLVQMVTATSSIVFCTLGAMAYLRFDISHPSLNPNDYQTK